MKITLIGCPFQTSYGAYIESLKAGIERAPGDNQVQWVASNCGCGDPMETGRHFQARQLCNYFEMPNALGEHPSRYPWKRWLRVRVRHASYYFRARRYNSLIGNAEIAHFQQILNAYGSSAVFHWLRQPSPAAKVITIHEFDQHQQEFPEHNKLYRFADALIVHCEEMREKLLNMGIAKEKAHVVLQGTDIPAHSEAPREGLVFYAGHKPMSGKGIQTLFQAMAILKGRWGDKTPILSIHGHYGTEVPEEAKRLSREAGVADRVNWINQIPMKEIPVLYEKSELLLLPYSGSFAGMPAAIAAANELPVVCTRKAGIPDHLGEWGSYIAKENPQELADRIQELLTNTELRSKLAAGLRKRAEQVLNWDAIAEKTLGVYQAAAASKLGRVQAAA